MENIALIRNTDLAPDRAGHHRGPGQGRPGAQDGRQGQRDPAASRPAQQGDAYHIYPLYSLGRRLAVRHRPPPATRTRRTWASGTARVDRRVQQDQGAGREGRRRAEDARSPPRTSIATFTGKKCAFLISGPWAIADVKKAGIKYDITPVPGFAGGKPAQPFLGVQAFYVAAKGKSKALAQEFVTNYVTNPDLAMALYDADPRPPALTAAIDQVKASDPDLAKLLEAGKDGLPLPAIPEMAAIWDPFGKAEAAVIGGADPAKTHPRPPARRSPARSTSNERIACRPAASGHRAGGPSALGSPRSHPRPRGSKRRSPRSAVSRQGDPARPGGRRSRSGRRFPLVEAGAVDRAGAILVRDHRRAALPLPDPAGTSRRSTWSRARIFLIAFQVFPVLYTVEHGVHQLRRRPPRQQGRGDRRHPDRVAVSRSPGSTRVRRSPSRPRATRRPARWSSCSSTRRPSAVQVGDADGLRTRCRRVTVGADRQGHRGRRLHRAQRRPGRRAQPRRSRASPCRPRGARSSPVGLTRAVRGQGQPGLRRRLRLRHATRDRQDVDRRRGRGLLRRRRRRAACPGLEGRRRASQLHPGGHRPEHLRAVPRARCIWNFAFAIGSSALHVRARHAGCALALHSPPDARARKLYRMLLVLPYAMPAFAMLLVWRDMFNTDFGLINRLLRAPRRLAGAGRGRPGWRCSLVQLWLGYPYMFLVATGALQAIPRELTEAVQHRRRLAVAGLPARSPCRCCWSR